MSTGKAIGTPDDIESWAWALIPSNAKAEQLMETTTMPRLHANPVLRVEPKAAGQ